MAEERLSRNEMLLLALPTAAGFVFGLLALLIPVQFASISGFPGNDTYVYRIAGAATLGYGVAGAFALREGRWLSIRPIVAGVLVFNLVSLFACAASIVDGSATWIVYLITVASVAFVLVTAALLIQHGMPTDPVPDTPPALATMLGIGTALALVTGLLPVVIPVQLGQLFGFRATDVFLYRQTGAATLGYVLVGVLLISSRRWQDMRWGAVMSVVFNGGAFLFSVIYLIGGGASWAGWIIAPASLGATLVGIWALLKRGQVAPLPGGRAMTQGEAAAAVPAPEPTLSTGE